MRTKSPRPRRRSRPVPLQGGHELELERQPGRDVLRIRAADGAVRLVLAVTADGPVLRLEGAELCVEATGPLSVNAERVAIHGREGVSITSGGDAALHAAGDLDSQARTQNLTDRKSVV